MKKFYAFAAVAMAALSMNAQLYVVGNGDGLAWDPAAPLEIAAENGAYTFTVTNFVEMKISTTFGDWDTFNGGALCAQVGEDQLGTDVLLYPSDGNLSAPWKGDYTIVVKLGAVDDAAGTINMTTTTPKPTGATPIYLRGDFVEGWAASEQWQFSSEDGVNYTFTCAGETKILAGQEFKIADADWGAINYGVGGLVAVGEEQEWNYNANNSSLEEDFEGTITFALEGSKEPIYVTFEAGEAGVNDIVVEGNEAVEYFNLQGVRVANPENGLFIARQGNKVVKVVK